MDLRLGVPEVWGKGLGFRASTACEIVLGVWK